MRSLGNEIPSYAVSVVWERQEPPLLNKWFNCNPELFLTTTSPDVRYTCSDISLIHLLCNCEKYVVNVSKLVSIIPMTITKHGKYVLIDLLPKYIRLIFRRFQVVRRFQKIC